MTGDILNAIKATLYDRISNPLVGAFIASNLFWNYKFIWILFSSMTVDEKFEHVEKLYPNGFYEIGYFVVIPAFIAYVYLYIIPEISQGVYEHYQTTQKKLKEIKQNIEDETPLTQEESRKLRIEIRMLEIKHQEEINISRQKYDEQDVEIGRVTSENNQLRTNLEDSGNKIAVERTSHEAALKILSDEKESIEFEIKKQRSDTNSTNAQLLDAEKHYRLEKKNSHERESHVDELLNTNSRLQDENRKLLSELNNKRHVSISNSEKNSEDNQRNEFIKDELRIIKILVDNNFSISVTGLESVLKMSKIKFDVFVEDLVAAGHVDYMRSQHGHLQLKLNQKGKRYALKNGLD